jgi:exopolysaccharide production protein ExoY
MALRLQRLRGEAPAQNANTEAVRLAPPIAEPTFYERQGKRVLDLVLIVLFSPLWIIVYAAIMAFILVADGRPIHYRSERIGRNGKKIPVLKFRTMQVNADSRLAGLLAADPALGDEFKAAVKLRQDPRVTTSGRWLRRTSLDELPQLFNVCLGEMSLVGPRPVLQSELDDFYGDYADEVIRHRPGMTGLWQVSGRSLLTYEERVALDLQYSRSCALTGDLTLLARTLPSVILARGAY